MAASSSWGLIGTAWNRVSSSVSATTGFLSRHKKKVLAVGAIAGGLYAYKRCKPIIDEIQASMKLLQEMQNMGQGGAMGMGGDPGAAQLMRQHERDQQFDRCIHVANSTFLKLATQNLKPQLDQRFDLQAIRGQMSKGVPHNQQLWDEFKVQGISRALSCIYGLAMLNALLKVQFAIVSRHKMKRAQQSAQNANAFLSVLGGDAGLGGSPGQLSEEDATQAEGRFLQLCGYLQQDGMVLLYDAMEHCVQNVCARYKLDTQCTYEEVLGMLHDIRAMFEGLSADEIRNISSVLQGTGPAGRASSVSSSSDLETELSRVLGRPPRDAVQQKHGWLLILLPPIAELEEEINVAYHRLTSIPDPFGGAAAAAAPAASQPQSSGFSLKKLIQMEATSGSSGSPAGTSGSSSSGPPQSQDPMQPRMDSQQAQQAAEQERSRKKTTLLCEMLEETTQVLTTASFERSLSSAVGSCLRYIESSAKGVFPAPVAAGGASERKGADATLSAAGSADTPVTVHFAKAMMALVKAYDGFITIGSSSGIPTSSPVLDELCISAPLHELASTVFYPLPYELKAEAAAAAAPPMDPSNDPLLRMLLGAGASDPQANESASATAEAVKGLPPVSGL